LYTREWSTRGHSGKGGSMTQGLRAVAVGVVAAAIAFSTGPTAGSQAPEMVQVTAGDAAHAEAVLRALAEGLPYVPGELLVRFKEGAGPRESGSALRVLQAPVEPGDMHWIGEVLHLRGIDIEDPVHAAENLSRQPEVLYAQPNYISRVDSVPNDPGYSQQWNLPAINMPQAWDINSSAGSGIIVAVVDTGLTTRDGTFGFRLYNGSGFTTFAIPFAKANDFDHSRVQVGVDLQPFGGWQTSDGPLIFDAVGHGTHVAATIAQQTNNSLGHAGIANGVTILPIKACYGPWDLQMFANHAAGSPGFATASAGGCPTSAWVAGIRHAADNGAKAINLSLGGSSPQPAAQDALNYAVSRGVFVAISGGNDAREGNATHYPAFYASQIDGAMAVAAVTPARERALYSNTGSYIEIAAPGGAGSTGSSSEQVWQTASNQSDLLLAPARLAPAFNRSQNLGVSGTSMAAPHVTALAALLHSQGITKPSAIEAAIKRFARDLGTPGRDDEYGAGLIDARATLRGLGVTR
jgi:serine protease